MSVTRRTAAKAGMISALMFGLRSLTTEAKDNKPGGGFGATASVSVNSGNNSGNQSVSYQENQAVITSSGAITLAQGNADGGSVQQGQVVSSLPSTGGDGSVAGQRVCAAAISLNVAVADSQVSTSEWYVPMSCACQYCQAAGAS